MTSPPEGHRSGLVLPWGWLTLGLGIVAIASLGTLAVIAKKQGADSLSTIALALAILSFAAQLIVALAQALAGTQQLSQADKVNADTRSSLAEIRATSSALLSNQSGQFSQVLNAALKVAIPAAVEDVTPDSAGDSDNVEGDRSAEELERRLFVRLNEQLSKSGSSLPNPAASSSPIESALLNRLTTYPDEKRGKEAMKALNSLSSRTAAMFGRNADSISDQLRRGQASYLLLAMRDGSNELGGSTKELVNAGLFMAKRTSQRGVESTVFRVSLTDLGIDAAGLILGQGIPPDWLLSMIDTEANARLASR